VPTVISWYHGGAPRSARSTLALLLVSLAALGVLGRAVRRR
jgi:hypothetical protein